MQKNSHYKKNISYISWTGMYQIYSMSVNVHISVRTLPPIFPLKSFRNVILRKDVF